jgi:mono/diheme cytochrome c family protein
MRIKRRTRRYFWRALRWLPAVAVAGFLYLYLRPPARVAPSSIRVDMSPERIQRGEYVFTTLCACDGCHSERDFTRMGGPVVVSGRGKGMVMPFQDLPGRVVASNITPDQESGIGAWTDGEKIRAIREGIGRDGRALFPEMPYESYRLMADDDVQALVAYMNSLPPVRNPLPKTEIAFPQSMLMKSIPTPVTFPVPSPDAGGGEIYGQYVAAMGGCEDCHTPASGFQKDTTLLFAGGRLFVTPYGTVASANITPDEETGIGKWGMMQFLERLDQFRQIGPKGAPPATPEQFTIMPWAGYPRLKDEDMEALFLFIKTRPARSHKVQIHPTANTR